MTDQEPISLTNWEKLVLKSGEELSPAKLNESLDKRLGFVTTNLALIASVATGFGLFADLAGPLRENSNGLRWVLALLLSSVVVSLVASSPNWWSRVDVNDLESIESYYASRYRWRSWLVRFAILLFTCAVALAAVTVWSVIDERPDPLTSLSYTAGEKPTVGATVTAASLDPGEVVETELRGCVGLIPEMDCEDGGLLARDSSRTDSSGQLAVTLSVVNVGAEFDAFTLVVRAGNFEDTRTIRITSP